MWSPPEWRRDLRIWGGRGMGRARGKPSSTPNGRTWNAADPGRPRTAEASRAALPRPGPAAGLRGGWSGVAASVAVHLCGPPRSGRGPLLPAGRTLIAASIALLTPPAWQNFLCETGPPRALAGSALPARPRLLAARSLSVLADALAPRRQASRRPPAWAQTSHPLPDAPGAGRMRAGLERGLSQWWVAIPKPPCTGGRKIYPSQI